MKKMRPLPLFIVLAFLGGLLYSCSKEETKINEDNQKSFKSEFVYSDCETQCIEEGSGDFFAKSDQVTVTYGSSKSPKTKVVDVVYYNTETHFVLKVKSDEGFSDLVVNSIAQGIKADPNVWGTYTFPLTEGWQACDNITLALQVAGNGPQAVFTINYNLIGICPSCEESFAYVDNKDGTYTFTYTPEEDLTDVEVVFTFAQGSLTSGLDETWENNGQTYHKTMSFEKCVPVSWTVSLQADCNGKQKQSNVFTDFKIGDVSKKGEEDKIILTCPE